MSLGGLVLMLRLLIMAMTRRDGNHGDLKSEGRGRGAVGNNEEGRTFKTTE